jgi:hypothetical protein
MRARDCCCTNQAIRNAKAARATKESTHGRCADSGFEARGAAGCPQLPQKAAPGFSSWPHLGHPLFSPETGAPHSEQNFPEASAPQEEQRI